MYSRFYLLIVLFQVSYSVYGQSITGSRVVCPGSKVFYQVNVNCPNCDSPQISVSGGTPDKTDGFNVNVTWGSGTAGSISFRFKPKADCGDCFAGNVSQSITIKPAISSATSIIIDGASNNLCEGDYSKLTATFPNDGNYSYNYLWYQSVNGSGFKLYQTTPSSVLNFLVPGLGLSRPNSVIFQVKRRYTDCALESGLTTSPTLYVNPKAPAMTFTTSAEMCNKKGGITITGITGVDTKYRLQIKNYQTHELSKDVSNRFIELPAGTYYYKLYNYDDPEDAKCTKEDTFSIVNSSYKLNLAIANSTPITCSDKKNGKVNLILSNGSSPFQYTIEKPGGLPTHTFLNSSSSITIDTLSAAGIYSVSATDANGCSTAANVNFTLTKPSELKITDPANDIKPTHLTCHGVATGAVQINHIIGGTLTSGKYTVQLVGSNKVLQTTNDATKGNHVEFRDIAAGTYSITITDDNGCTTTYNSAVTITQPQAITINDVQKTHLTCFESNNGTIKVKATNNLELTYSLSGTSADGTSYTNKAPTSTDATGYRVFTSLKASNTAGYSIRISNTNCFVTTTAIITQPAVVAITSSVIINVKCSQQQNGSIALKATGGTGTLTYTLTGDNYKNETIPPIAKTGAQGAEVLFSNLFASETSGYSVLVTDATGCISETKIYPVTHPSPITKLSSTIENILCFNANTGNITYKASGGTGNLIYSLTGKDYLNAAVALNVSKAPGVEAVFTGLKASDGAGYTMSVTDANGCPSLVETGLILTQPADLIINNTTVSDVKCNGESNGAITTSVIGGTGNYYISTDNGVSWSDGVSKNGLKPGTYSIKIKDDNGCVKSFTSTINQPAILQITVTSKTDAKCNEAIGSATVQVSGGKGGYKYEWLWLAKNKIVSASASASSLEYGRYRVTSTDENLCQVSTMVSINNIGGPGAEFINISPTTCSDATDGKAEIVFTSNQSMITGIRWPNGVSTNTATGLSPGGNEVVVSTSTCNYNFYVNIPSPAPIALSDSIVLDPNCHGECNGKIELNAKGGTGPYTYVWRDGKTGNSLNDLCAGSYNLKISDSKGCSRDYVFTLNNPEQLSVNLGGSVEQCEGMIKKLDAGNAGAFYSWSSDNGFTSTSRQVEVDKAGTYTVKVTDSKGCTTSDTFKLITNNSLLTSDFLMSSEAYAGDTVVLVEISWPSGDKILWEYDSTIQRQSSDGSYEQLIFPEAGEYSIKLKTRLGECQSTVVKKIMIYDRNDTTLSNGPLGYRGPFIKVVNIYPNPNQGVFKTKVELREASPIEVKIYNGQNNQTFYSIRQEGQDQYEFDVDLSKITKGVYLMVIKAEGTAKVSRVIIY